MSKADVMRRYALWKVGKPYKRGEEFDHPAGPILTPEDDGDCSGIFYAMGIEADVRINGRRLTRETANTYHTWSTPIAEPSHFGDCCWFPAKGEKTHMVVYIGMGQVIEAGNHGPGGVYPGHGYVGLCTVAQINARGGVWGRFADNDFGELTGGENDMNDAEHKTLAKIAEGNRKLSFTVAISNALAIGDTAKAAALNSQFYELWPAGESGLPKGWPEP